MRRLLVTVRYVWKSEFGGLEGIVTVGFVALTLSFVFFWVGEALDTSAGTFELLTFTQALFVVLLTQIRGVEGRGRGHRLFLYMSVNGWHLWLAHWICASLISIVASLVGVVWLSMLFLQSLAAPHLIKIAGFATGASATLSLMTHIASRSTWPALLLLVGGCALSMTQLLIWLNSLWSGMSSIAVLVALAYLVVDYIWRE